MLFVMLLSVGGVVSDCVVAGVSKLKELVVVLFVMLLSVGGVVSDCVVAGVSPS